MKLSRAFLVWAALAVCAVLVIGAMTWLTRGVLASERDRAKAEQERSTAENRADLEERTRLALWRMDALGSAIMLRENRYPAERYQTEDPSKENQEVRLRFQVHEYGKSLSPELDPNPPMDSGPMAENKKQLRALLASNPQRGDAWTQLSNAANEGEAAWNAMPKDASKEQAYNKLQRLSNSGELLRKDVLYQTSSNVAERVKRGQAMSQSVDNAITQSDQTTAPNENGADLTTNKLADIGLMRAVWLSGELFLLRQVIWNSTKADSKKVKESSVQGAWLDSKNLRDQLLNEVNDLLPNAKLFPVEGQRAAEDSLAMVSFPFRLERNEIVNIASKPTKTLFGAALGLAWLAVGLAVLASFLLVHGVMRLSERRASFVSAVTHELRTPLTTFRLYSDMLESGAVREEKRGEYLRVLSREADRLSHLVENVLAFSRIERGNARSNVRVATVASLIEQSRERLETRLATAGLTLEIGNTCDIRVRADTTAVEHILFNLIDNAAKYAAGGDPPTVIIRAQDVGRFVAITVNDHGPGVADKECKRIFRAFHKSARDAAESMPGVGLGLALSRRLARAQGGDLECTTSPVGACFVLRLPVAPQAD